MERRTILVAVLLVATVAVTSLFWNLVSVPSFVQGNQPSYQVKVRRYDDPPVTVVFYRDEVVITDIIIREPATTWYNLTLSKGPYVVEVYVADTGVFLKDIEIYIAKDIELTV